MGATTERLYRLLTSPKLAIGLLVVILACCLAGVTVVRDERAWALIFSTLWFNGLLVLLAVSAAAAFFSRIWKRKLTLVSVGMIVFHLSFVALLGGVVYNGLFHFRGVLRLTEGESLPNGALESYDRIEAGRLFDIGRFQGRTTLVRMHRDFKVGGGNKRAAYEIEVGEGPAPARSVIYITEYFDADGVRYFCSKEGYSVLVVLSDPAGEELYGAHVPLQSLEQPDGSHLYATGTATTAAGFPFPAPPEPPRFELLVTYWPSPEDREGQVSFEVGPLPVGAPVDPHAPGAPAPPPGQDPHAMLGPELPATRAPPAAARSGQGEGGAGTRGGSTKGAEAAAIASPSAAGKPVAPRKAMVPVGATYDAGDFQLSPREIRYWVGMDVRYDPGLNFSLGSLVFGLVGMVLTFVGRIRQGARKRAG